VKGNVFAYIAVSLTLDVFRVVAAPRLLTARSGPVLAWGLEDRRSQEAKKNTGRPEKKPRCCFGLAPWKCNTGRRCVETRRFHRGRRQCDAAEQRPVARSHERLGGRHERRSHILDRAGDGLRRHQYQAVDFMNVEYSRMLMAIDATIQQARSVRAAHFSSNRFLSITRQDRQDRTVCGRSRRFRRS